MREDTGRRAGARRAATALRIAIVGGCIAWVLWGIDLATLAAVMARYRALPMAVALGISLAAYVFLGVRLRVLAGRGLDLAGGVAASVLALGVNNVLPAKLGEIAKALYLRARTGAPAATMLGVVFWERFADVNALVLLALGTLLAMHLDLVVWPLAAVVVAIWAALGALRPWWGLAEHVARRLPGRHLALVLLDLGRYVRAGLASGVLAGLAALTVIVWAVYATQVLVIVLWVAHLPLTIGQALAVFVLSALGFAAPGTPGGLGVFEAAVVVSLGWFGVSKEEAIGVGVVMRVIQFVPTTLGAGVVLARSGLTLRTLTG